jgi:pimeloyl-ACP methyl ester carboxylesterase
VRLDGDGIGDSNRRQGTQLGNSKRGPDDIREVVAALGERDASSFVLVGVSSGGFHATNALSLKPAGICLINPALTSEMRDEWRSQARHEPALMSISLAPPALRSDPIKWFLHKFLRFKIRATSWLSVARVGAHGVPVLLILARSDVRNFTSNPAWWITHRLLESRGLLRVEVLPYNDHSLESLAMRDLVAEKLHSWIAERYEEHEPALEAL